MRIDYCEVCDTRLTEEDFDSGKAVRDANDNVYCAACAPASAPISNSTIKKSASNAQDPHGRATPRANARTGATAAQKPPVPLAWVLIAGGVGVLALIGLLYAFGAIGSPRNPKPPADVAGADNPPAAQPLTVPAAAGVKIASPLIPSPRHVPTANASKPHGIFDEMAKEHDREFDPEQRKVAAENRLKEAVESRTKHPQDPWTYLEMLHSVQSGTPSSDDAARIITALKVPVDKTNTAGWWRDWTFAQPDAKPVLLFDFDGRKNILQTKPSGHDAEYIFNRAIQVPADKPFLTIVARTEDKGATRIVLEIEGKQQALEELKGASWRAFDLDLSEFKGKTAAIQIRQFSDSASVSNAYFAPPVFQAAHDAAASLFAFNPNAPVFERPKPVAPPKRAFVASASWKESPGWNDSVNLLALADLKSGVVAGSWTLGENGALHTNNAKYSRIAIPYKLPAQYNVRAVFERKAGESDACLILAHGSRQFNWQIGAEKNKSFAITLVGGKKFEGNPAAHSTENCLKNNQRYTTVVEVRKDRISAYLDGKLIVEWVPEMGDLSLSENWKLPAGKSIAVAAQESEVVFHSLEMLEVK